jgi:hypothetical protein
MEILILTFPSLRKIGSCRRRCRCRRFFSLLDEIHDSLIRTSTSYRQLVGRLEEVGVRSSVGPPCRHHKIPAHAQNTNVLNLNSTFSYIQQLCRSKFVKKNLRVLLHLSDHCKKFKSLIIS